MKNRIKNYELGIKNWILNNRLEFVLLLLILIIGAIFRLYRISEYMTFLGDEGRDAIIVRRLLVNFDPILIGPGTSIGNMYLGPLYYYLIAPALLFSGFSPAGPSILVALLGVATIFLVWYVTRSLFTLKGATLQGRTGALISALLYAVSPVVIIYSRSSWNPNVMPFFSLIIIYSVWKIWQEGKHTWLIVAGISLAFALQSHYLGLLLVPVILLFGIWKFVELFRNSKLEIRNFQKNIIQSLLVFFLLMSPLVIFDFRHNFINFKAIDKFFTERQTTVSIKPWTAIPKIEEIVLQTNSSLLGAGDVDLTWLYTYGIIFLTAYVFVEIVFTKKKIKFKNREYWTYVFQKINSKPGASYLLLIIWLLTSYFGLGLYKQHVYDHYFGFFFTAPFILVGGLTSYIFSYFNKWWKIGLIVFFIYAVSVNLSKSPIKYPPNRQMQRAQEIAGFIREQTDDRKFNLAVIAERNYEDGYQYFLEKWNQPVVDIDPLNYEGSLADQLFVICEMEKSKCDPVHNPKTEIANFGWSKIEEEWNVAGLTVYKLVHADPSDK